MREPARPARAGLALLLLLVCSAAACGGSSGGGDGAAAGWGQPERLGTGQYVGTLAGDGNGRAVLVWIAPGAEQTGASIVGRRLAPAAGWAPLETIDPPGPNLIQNPVAAMDARGGIIAVWPDTSAVLASRFAGAMWSAPAPISRQLFSRFGLKATPAAAFDASGRALAVWSECCGASAFEMHRTGSTRLPAG